MEEGGGLEPPRAGARAGVQSRGDTVPLSLPIGANDGGRTHMLLIRSQVLIQFSYVGVVVARAGVEPACRA